MKTKKNVNVSMNLESGFEKWLCKGRKKETVKNYLGSMKKLIGFLNKGVDDFYRMSLFKLKCESFKLEGSRAFLSLSESSKEEYGVAWRNYLKYVKLVESINKKQAVIIKMSPSVGLRKAA